jgi:transcriptional regulator GlxA family with amidase domain
MAELARAGASEVIFRGLEDFGARARVLMRRADGTSVMGVALDRLDPWLTPGARAAFSYVVRHANRPVSVAEVAAALNVNRKTLRNRLTRAGFPAPSTVIAWCRLLRAAQALEDPRRTVCSVATALGFGSPAALRNLFRRHAGRRAAEVRASGGTAWLLDRFAARLIGSGRYDRTA